MNPRDARPIALAVLAIVALALVAATLPSTVTTGGVGGGGGIAGSGDEGLLPEPPTPEPPGDPIRIPYLAEALAVIAVLVAAVALLSLIVHWREALVITVLVTVAIVVVWAIARFLARRAGEVSLPVIFAGNGTAFGGPATPDAIVPPTPRWIVLIGIAVVAIAAIAVVLAYGRGEGESSGANGRPSPAELTAVGRAAGRAADRIEAEHDVANEVYRAWHEMTELLDVPSRHAATPGEFADAAIHAGLSRDDVIALTTLFEDVRYGGRAATPDDERHALRTFRRIEAEYAGDDT